jgi:hypothetical protein
LAVIEKASVFPSKSFSLARSTPSLSQLSLRSNLSSSSTGAGLQTASQSSNALGALLHGSYPEAIVTEPKGARATDEIFPTPISTFAVSQPLHPGSATMLSPAVQIALCVIGASGIGGSSRESMLAQSQPTVHLAAEAAPVATQILHLQLEPENLGKIIIKMRLSGSKLELQVDAERPETMHLIGNDKKLLSDRLQSAGYAIDTLVIQSLDSHASHSGQGAAAGASQQQHGDYRGGGTNFHDRPSMRDSNSPSPPSLDGDTQDTARIRPIDGELYL